MSKSEKILDRRKFFSGKPLTVIVTVAAVAQFFLIAGFAASGVDYSRDSCAIIFAANSPAADGVLKPGEAFSASFSVYNGSPVVNNYSQELWPSASGPTPASTRYKLVPSTGSNYDTTWTGGNAANVAPYTAELYGGTNSGYGYLIGNVAGVDARTGLGNGSYKAPTTPGTYAFRFQLKESSGSWHPTVSCSKNLVVKADTPPQPTVRINPYICNKPYPALIKLGVGNGTGSRTDQCASAVQFGLQASSPGLNVPGVTGTIDSTTVTVINNYLLFFGGPNATASGQLTAADLTNFQTVFGLFKTSTPPGGGGGGGQPNTRPANPYVCNKPYPGIKSGYKDKSGRADSCVSAVQYNLQAATTSLKVTGVTDAPTVTAIKNFQTFFKAAATGELTPDQVSAIATAFGPYKTSTPTNDGGGGGGSGGGGGGGGGADKKLDIVIAGANFGSGNNETLNSFAKSTSQLILGTPPYSTHKNDIVFRTVNAGGVSCGSINQTGDGRDIRCDYAAVATALAAAGVPYDKVIVVANTNVYGGTAQLGGQFSTTTLYGAVIARHEFSHTMGLYDEYVYDFVQNQGQSARANCKDSQPNPYWTSSDPQVGGCTYPEWARAGQTSIMRELYSTTFTTPAVRVLEEAINSYTK